MSNVIRLEICLDSVESALAAVSGGAHRIELCSNLLEGGTTPNAGLIAMVRNKIAIELCVMIRPRGGDFCYSDSEFQIMQYDVLRAKELGADGVVFGILERNGHVDVPRTRSLVELARPLKVTFHRAFDMSQDLDESLQEVIRAGVDRVLTSGGGQSAADGIDTLARLVTAAKHRVVIMPGGGINETNVRSIITNTGAREIHASVKSSVASPMQYRNDKLSLSAIPGREYHRFVVDAEMVRRLWEAASEATRTSR